MKKIRTHKESKTQEIQRRNKNTIKPFAGDEAKSRHGINDYEIARELGIDVSEVRGWSHNAA